MNSKTCPDSHGPLVMVVCGNIIDYYHLTGSPCYHLGGPKTVSEQKDSSNA